MAALFTETADRLEAAIIRLQAWSATIPTSSRLHDAIIVLRRVADQNALPPDRIVQSLAFHAFHTAYDFIEIASYLPENRVASIRKALNKAVLGALDERDTRQEPFQLQSELRIGAALRRAGLKPVNPKLGNGKTPDFIIKNATFTYAVEVKRPSKSKGCIRLVRAAQPQISAAPAGGVIVLDITTLVSELTSTELREQVNELTRIVRQEIWVPERGFKPGFEKTLGLVIVARAIERVELSEGGYVRVLNVANASTFAPVENSLQQHRAEWLTQGIQRGLIPEHEAALRDLQSPSSLD